MNVRELVANEEAVRSEISRLTVAINRIEGHYINKFVLLLEIGGDGIDKFNVDPAILLQLAKDHLKELEKQLLTLTSKILLLEQ